MKIIKIITEILFFLIGIAIFGLFYIGFALLAINDKETEFGNIFALIIFALMNIGIGLILEQKTKRSDTEA